MWSDAGFPAGQMEAAAPDAFRDLQWGQCDRLCCLHKGPKDSRGLVPHSGLCDGGVKQDSVSGGQGSHSKDVINTRRVPGLACGHHPAQSTGLSTPLPQNYSTPAPDAAPTAPSSALTNPPSVPVHVPPEPSSAPHAASAPSPAPHAAPRTAALAARPPPSTSPSSPRSSSASFPASPHVQVQTISKCQRARYQRA